MRSARIDGVIASVPDLNGRVLAIYEIYVGLRGQLRVGLVDHLGRVYHYDASELSLNTATRYRFEQLVGLA